MISYIKIDSRPRESISRRALIPYPYDKIHLKTWKNIKTVVTPLLELSFARFNLET